MVWAGDVTGSWPCREEGWGGNFLLFASQKVGEGGSSRVGIDGVQLELREATRFCGQPGVRTLFSSFWFSLVVMETFQDALDAYCPFARRSRMLLQIIYHDVV